MRVFTTFIAFALAMLLVALPAFAIDDMSISLSPAELTINTSETKYTEITISNNQDVEDTFSISVWPSIKWAGVTPVLEKYNVKINANSNKSIKLHFTVASDAKEMIPSFLVTAKSLTNSSITDSKSINVKIVRKSAVYISDIKLSKYALDPGEMLSIEVTITNLAATASDDVSLQTNIECGVEIIKRFDNYVGSVEKKSTKLVSHSYSFGKTARPGTCFVKSTLKDYLNRAIDSRSIEFKINRISNVTHKKAVSYTLLSQSITIKVKNEGNSLEENLYVTESIPSFVKNFFYPEKEPDKVEVKDNRVVYSWSVPHLLPGEEITIKYSISLVTVWIAGLLVIILVILVFNYTYKPKIIKKHKLVGEIKRGKEVLISLEIRNPTLHEIKSVIVRDFVSPIATVVKKFDTVRPEIKTTEMGTELVWKLKALKPREERILTYRIKPVVEIIGTLRLAKATIEYVDRKKKKKAIASKRVFIKPG